jgi:hypothetical protein
MLSLIQKEAVMNEMKFTCPSCGQHVECDASHAGENFPCPACAMLVRVPSDAGFTEAPVATVGTTAPSVTAELGSIFYTSTKPSGDGLGHECSTASENPPPQPSSEAAISPAHHASEKTHATSDAERRSEARCVCPVCKSELQISLEMALPAADATLNLSFEEREQQIAAARETHPGLHPTFKPRLDKILGDEETRKTA